MRIPNFDSYYDPPEPTDHVNGCPFHEDNDVEDLDICICDEIYEDAGLDAADRKFDYQRENW
jgi:hypothetical protein